ncbi:MAG: UDP-N-acetylmuramate--L-alanine ligase [Lentimicrobiaceae bacterium]|nr:UDP-N-acetylmuramate--L-alanine ligase [Lentimicrobiaceae bacterium]
MQKVYFLGIGGIGMSALARYYRKRGAEVYGYDRTQSPLTEELESEGIHIHYEERVPPLESGKVDLCIYTPAIPKTNREFLYFEQSGIPFIKRSQALGMIANDKICFAVAGTHGKTSITSILAHIFHENRPITAFIGGISNNYNTNFIDNEKAYTVIVEADEFDRSFLSLEPDFAVITAIDADHLDIYGNKQQLQKSFNEFASRINPAGFLVTKPQLARTIAARCKVKTYSLNNPQTDYHIKKLRIGDKKLCFDLVTPHIIIKDILFEKIGLHNLENAVAAAAICDLEGIGHTTIKRQLESYKGVKRRFEYIIQREDFIYIDDYAHHPQEITACVKSIRTMYPNKKLCGVFQPHLFSRTRDFADDFARSLELLDTVVLLDIYPARELPIEGVDSQMLLDKIKKTEKILVNKENLIANLKNINPEILVTMGAGDIDRLVDKIKNAFTL